MLTKEDKQRITKAIIGLAWTERLNLYSAEKKRLFNDCIDIDAALHEQLVFIFEV